MHYSPLSQARAGCGTDMGNTSILQAESSQHLSPSSICDAQGSAVQVRHDPLSLIAMLALGQHLHQALRFQPLQMHARGCWRYPCDHRKLRARLRSAVHQAIKHSRACRLTNRGRDSANFGILVPFCIHSLMLDEVLLYRNWHPAAHASELVNRTRRPPRRNPGFCGDRLCADCFRWRIRDYHHRENTSEDQLLHSLPH